MTGNFEGWHDYLTDDVVLTIAGDRGLCPLCGTFTGKKDYCEAFRTLHVQFEILGDLKLPLAIIEGDRVSGRMSSHWRSRGSGKTLFFESFNLWVFEGDLIKEFTLFFDTAAVTQFVGGDWTLHRAQ